MIILITGGSGSGKSAFAENVITQLKGDNRIYIATMFPFDEESHRKIQRHLVLRANKQFQTKEQYTNLGAVAIPENSTVLVECIANLLANEMYSDQGAKTDPVGAVIGGIRSLIQKSAHLCIVTNEVFSDGLSYSSETRTYQAHLGAVNQYLAQMAQVVVEVVYGVPNFLRGDQELLSKAAK